MSHSTALHNISYRSDIDGLRALAILPVVLFHAFPNLIPGGFIGVDIFFVISGYLITSILLKDIQSGTYSLKSFYIRRVRRIFPALGVVLFISLVFAWVMFTPEEYQRLGKHVAGGVGFVANFMLWKEVGYFDAAADTKPLLHLWSLGIEEQFYIVWPLLLYFVSKRSWNVLYVIATVALLSFTWNIFRIGVDPSGAFYSPFSRSWELALGALLAYQATQPIPSLGHIMKRHATPLSALGLLLILIGFVVINESRSFPGWWALLPALGSGLLIAAGPQAFVNRHFLSQRWMVWVGLISFSLYLWHWPLLSFARVIYSETPSIEVRVILLLCGFLLAWLTYRFLEKPIRSTKFNRKTFWIIFLLVLSIGVMGHLINKSKGFPSRQFGLLNADPASLAMGADRSRLLHDCGIAESDKKSFQSCWRDPRGDARLAVLGDSKGEAIFYGFAREALADAHWLMLGNMTPMVGVNNRFDEKNKIRTDLALKALSDNKKIEVVVLAVALRSIFAVPEVYSKESVDSSPFFDSSIEGLGNTIQILELSGKKVVFYMDHPGFPDPKSCISGGMTQSDFLNQIFRRKLNPRCSISYSQYKQDTERYLHFVSKLKVKHPQLFIYDSSPLLCDIANNRCEISKEGNFLYSYGDHLSDYANSMIARDFLPKIAHLLKN